MIKEKIKLKFTKREINGCSVFDVTDQFGNEYEMVHAVEFEKTGKFVEGKIEFFFEDKVDELPSGQYRLEPQHVPHIKR